MQSSEMTEEHQQEGSLKKRLKGVRRRKQSRRVDDRVTPFACGVVASKMKLVEARQQRDEGS